MQCNIAYCNLILLLEKVTYSVIPPFAYSFYSVFYKFPKNFPVNIVGPYSTIYGKFLAGKTFMVIMENDYSLENLCGSILVDSLWIDKAIGYRATSNNLQEIFTLEWKIMKGAKLSDAKVLLYTIYASL